MKIRGWLLGAGIDSCVDYAWLLFKYDKNLKWDLRCCALGGIKTFEDFFNLTEEDLK